MRAASVDVIIVNFNAGPLLTDCACSAFAAGAATVIVVDNHSSDNSLDTLETACADQPLHIIRNTVNRGFAAACNQGIAQSRAPLLLFLNPDSVITATALTALTETLTASPHHGMAGPRLCHPDGSEQAGGRRRFPTPANTFWRAFGLHTLARRANRDYPDFLLHRQPLPTGPVAVDAISGACMLVRRSAIDDVGGWDEGYFLHCEDLDWCKRFQLRGWQVLFVPDAIVHHRQGSCSRSRPLFVEWHKHRGMQRFFRKFYRLQHSAFGMAAIALGIWLRFILVALQQTITRAANSLRRRHD